MNDLTAVQSVEWTYDTGTYGKGLASTMTDPTGSTAYVYNRRGQLAREEKTIDGTTYVTAFDYDRDGQRSRIVYPSTRVVDFGHDFAGRPVSASSGGVTLVQSAAYLPFGPATQIVFGNGTARGMTYDARYRLGTHTLTGPGGTLAAWQYGHDAVGNITAITDLVDASWSRGFGYDEIHRLTSSTSGASLWGSAAWDYDAMGNLESQQVGTARSDAFSYATPTPKIASVSGLGGTDAVVYDVAGNEVVVGARSYAYAPRNHRAGAGVIEYAYDGRGVRTITEVSGSGISGWSIGERRYALYLPELSLLAETAITSGSAPGIEWEYVWFGGAPLAQINVATGAIHTYVTDHLGTPVLTTDASGAIDWRAELEPYGEVFTQREGSRHQPLRFPGQEAGPGEEYYNVFRWYRSRWGRYTQTDPIDFDGGDINLYRYAVNRPSGLSDPLGLRVRICCRPSVGRLNHCYIEQEVDGKRETWGLHNPNSGGLDLYFSDPSPTSSHRRDDPSDRGGTCESWREDCDGSLGQCIQRNFELYPVENYSEISAPTKFGSGRNSNTFVKCLAKKCGLSASRRTTGLAPGYYQPCPGGF